MKRKASTAKAAAWYWLSMWVRRKAADENGFVRCVTCGVQKHWKDLHAGHFVPKKRGLAVYFLEENVHPQCPQCNTWNGGMLIEYTRFMELTYGKAFVDELLQLSRTKKPMRLADFEEIENEYRDRCKAEGWA